MPATSIASRTNPRVKQLRAAFAGQARLAGGLVAIEGEHLLYEAVRSGVAIKAVFVDQRKTVPEWVPRAIEVIELTDEAFSSAVDTQSPQGIAALLVPRIWSVESVLSAQSQSAPLLLIAAGLQDPGNLGALLRSAEAFAATAVLTTHGTVSPWNQKAVRASAGSVFRMPASTATVAEIGALKRHGIKLYAATADAGDRSSSLMRANLVAPCALMIGNEGSGLEGDLLALADARISIPMPGRVESLNAAIAGSLLLYEASRRRDASQPATDFR